MAQKRLSTRALRSRAENDGETKSEGFRPTSTKFSSHRTPTSLRLLVTRGHASLRYFSLYFGKRTAKELSSARPPGFSSLPHFGIAQWSMPSWSQGLSFLCLLWFTCLLVCFLLLPLLECFPKCFLNCSPDFIFLVPR